MKKTRRKGRMNPAIPRVLLFQVIPDVYHQSVDITVALAASYSPTEYNSKVVRMDQFSISPSFSTDTSST